NQRWDETWKVSRLQQQRIRKPQRADHTQARCEQTLARFLNLFLWCKPLTPRPSLEPAPPPVNHPTSARLEPTSGPHRPAANYPWRRPRCPDQRGHACKKMNCTLREELLLTEKGIYATLFLKLWRGVWGIVSQESETVEPR